jgi:hypothetical protein
MQIDQFQYNGHTSPTKKRQAGQEYAAALTGLASPVPPHLHLTKPGTACPVRFALVAGMTEILELRTNESVERFARTGQPGTARLSRCRPQSRRC